MNNIVLNKTKSPLSGIALLTVFCLFAFAGKSYAWHFGPETDASNWEYEKAFGLSVSQKTSIDSELTAVSTVKAPCVEIKAENNGLLPAATGNLVYRKIQSTATSGTSGYIRVSFKFTAIREANSADGEYPQNCYFDICYINAEGDNVEHHYKSIENIGEKKSYSKNGKTYYIVTGEYVLPYDPEIFLYSSQDIQIRVWPQSGVNFQKLLISDVEALKPELPGYDNTTSEWTCPSNYTTSFKKASYGEIVPDYIPETVLSKPYVYLQGEMQTTTPAIPGYLPKGEMSRTVKCLKPGEYTVTAKVLITHDYNTSNYYPSNCDIYTGKSYDAASADQKTSISSSSNDEQSSFYYPSEKASPHIGTYYRIKNVSLKATVGTDGELRFTINNKNTSNTSNFNFIAIQDFTVTPDYSSGAGLDSEWEGVAPDPAPTTPPDDVPLLTVSPQSGYTFTHYHGSVYDKNPRPSDFPSGDNKEWKTSADDPRLASGVKLQRTHEYVHDVYVMPGDECELMPFSDFHTAPYDNGNYDNNKYFDTYHRWYDYTKDKACARLKFPSGDNNDQVRVYGDGSGNAKGHFGGWVVNSQKRAASHAIYQAPLNTNSDGVFDVIAIDVACHTIGNIRDVTNLTEPTLAYRHIFVIHSARKKADENNDDTYENHTEQSGKVLELLCPEGTPFQFRLDNFEYRGLGSSQKPTGYYCMKQTTEGGEPAFKYEPVYHYRVELLKPTGKKNSLGVEICDLIGSTTILGAYDASGVKFGANLTKNVDASMDDYDHGKQEETLCNNMQSTLVYTYKCINGYDRVIYWKAPTVGKYIIRLCAVDIVQENGNYVARDIMAQNSYGNLSDGPLVLQSYRLTVMPNKDANMVVEEQLKANDFAYKYQRQDSMVAEYGEPFDVVNFDFDSETKFMSNGTGDAYYTFPLSWEASAYGFGYDQKFDYNMYVIANKSGVARVPWKMSNDIYDRLYEETNGAKKGNFLYVNAASDPGHMAKVSLGKELCANNRVYVSAWVNEFNNNLETANLVFTFRGINRDTKQPEVISRYVTGYIPGGCNTQSGFTYIEPLGKGNPKTNPDYRGQWMHVYYYFDPPSDLNDRGYESYDITLENNCTSSHGADYAIDDIRAFICRPNIKASQTKPICNGEAYSHVQLATDFDLLLRAYAAVPSFSEQFSNVSKPTDLFYTIIDKDKFMAEIDKNSSTAEAFNASVVKGIYGATGDNDEYGKLTFYPYYEQNMLRSSATDEQKKTTTTREVSSSKRMLYFPDYIKSDGLKPDTHYWIVIAAYNYDVQSLYINPLSMCSNVREFTVTYGNIIKIDGQPTATRHGLNICSNQRPKISVDMTGVRASNGEEVSGYDHFDWFVGNKEAFEEAEYNDVSLEESLAAFRDLSGHYTDDETDLRNLSPTGNFTAEKKECLLHFIDEKKLSLYKTVEFPSTYDQFNKDPNGTSIALTIIPVDPYHDKDIIFCLAPIDLEIPISTREPSMKNGDDSGIIQYTMDDVPLRIGLTQLKKCCTVNPTNITATPSHYLIMPLRDIHIETTGVKALVEKSDDDLIYLVDTNDPAVKTNYAAFGAKKVNTFTSTTDKTGFGDDLVLYIGKVSDIEAEVWDKSNPSANPGNKCKLAFFNNLKFREGYWYTIRFNYQEKYTSTVTADQDVCPGDVLCTIKVVPEYQMWTGAANGNWNNDKNWQRVSREDLFNPTVEKVGNDFVTDGGTNDNDASFVPADFTKVIIPADPDNQLILYGLRGTDNKSEVTFAGGNGTSYFIKNMVKTATGNEPVVGYTTVIDTASYKINFDMSSVDLSDGNVACRAWYDHTCDQIHFNSEAQMVSQQYLNYNKAWADVEVVPGRWYTFTSPITNVVAGDFYLPSATGRQDTPLFEDINYSTSLNDRFKPAVYQRTWDASEAVLWHVDGDSTHVAKKLNWSHVYNETNVNYDTGKGSSIKVDVSAMPTKQPEKVKFRFPKADTKYTYYQPGNVLGEKEEEDVLAAAMVDGKRTYKIEDFTSAVEQVVGENTNGTKDTYYLVGNPFMCELDLEEFFKTNTQFEKKLWTLTEGSQRVVVMTGNAVISTSATNNALTQRYIPPFQSFFLALKTAPAEGSTIKAKFDVSMMHVPEESNNNSGSSKARKFAAPSTDEGLLRISTATADGIESAVVLADGIVRKTSGAETLFDSNLAEDVTVYSVINGQAMTIGEVSDVDTIPIGITRNNGETEIHINGVASFGRTMWIADAETGEIKELDEDITLKQSGNGIRYYLMSRLPSADKPEISTPLLRTDNHTVSIAAPAGSELTDLRIVTAGGINVTNIANAGSEYTAELAEGIYIITLRCNNASYTYKVAIW